MRCLNIVRVVIPPSSAHSFRIPVCDLKHKVAVWQGYGLDGSDLPWDTGIELSEVLESAQFSVCILGNFMVYGCEPVPQRPTWNEGIAGASAAKIWFTTGRHMV